MAAQRENLKEEDRKRIYYEAEFNNKSFINRGHESV